MEGVASAGLGLRDAVAVDGARLQQRLAALGVDVISVGALTHSAPAADIGLDWVRKA